MGTRLGRRPYLVSDHLVRLLPNLVPILARLLGPGEAPGGQGQEVLGEEGQLCVADILSQNRQKPGGFKFVISLISSNIERDSCQDSFRTHHSHGLPHHKVNLGLETEVVRSPQLCQTTQWLGQSIWVLCSNNLRIK